MTGSCVGGKQRETELASGIVAMGARVYDPYTGTFTQPDPIQGGGANAYGYTDGDPVNETDLSGDSVGFATVQNQEDFDRGTAEQCKLIKCGGGLLGLAEDFGQLAGLMVPGFGEEEAGADLLDGGFSTFTRDESGAVSKYTTYGRASAQDPEEFRPTLRYDSTGRAHFNKATGDFVETPHVHDPTTPGGVRAPRPEERP